MTQKISVKDTVAGTTVQMWEVDAEEAARYDPSRYQIQSPKPPPKKNPGGRGW